jgi:hypothetical protein
VGVFGDKLRRQRELRGISLDAISATTKISPRMLRAIEDERFDQLPGGVFNKGFVRAYARQVGLDEDDAISDYLAALRESQVQSQTILPNFRVPAEHATMSAEQTRSAEVNRNLAVTEESHFSYNHARGTQTRESHQSAAEPAPDRRLRTDDRRRQPRRSADREAHVEHAQLDERPVSIPRHEEDLEHDVPSAPLSFLRLDSAEPYSHVDSRSDRHQIAPVSTDNGSGRVPWEKLAVALLLATLTLAFWAFLRRSHSAAASQVTPSAAVTAPVAATPKPIAPTGTTPALAHNIPATSGAAVEPTAPPDSDVNPPLTKPHARPSAPQPPARFTLVIRAEQTAWISITADGEPVAQETLIAPANTSVRASREIVVKTGNAAGLSFMLGNKDISALGTPGEVRTYTFDATGLRASSAAPSANSAR